MKMEKQPTGTPSPAPKAVNPPPLSFSTKLRRYTKAKWERIWGKVDRPLRRVLSRSSLGSQLYYTLFSSAFRRECYATLAGRARYDTEHRALRRSYPLLRRNIHRLEKGMIMVPRRDVFGAGYINETVAIYARLQGHETERQNPELGWARDVLRAYFDMTSDVAQTAKARAKFEATETDAGCSAERIPYKRALGTPPTVAIDDFLALCNRRRSVRWFENRPVPREMLDKAMIAAGESPTACNRQPFTFRFFDDPALIAKVSGIPMGTKGFEHNFPVFGVIVGELANYTDERDRHLIYIDGSLAAMSFCLAAETQGLSTCLINWPDIPEREENMAKILGLRPDQRPVMCFAAGYPDPEGLVPRSVKKPLDILRSYNEANQ